MDHSTAPRDTNCYSKPIIVVGLTRRLEGIFKQRNLLDKATYGWWDLLADFNRPSSTSLKLSLLWLGVTLNSLCFILDYILPDVQRGWLMKVGQNSVWVHLKKKKQIPKSLSKWLGFKKSQNNLKYFCVQKAPIFGYFLFLLAALAELQTCGHSRPLCSVLRGRVLSWDLQLHKQNLNL